MSTNTALPNCLSQLLGDYISDDDDSNDEENVADNNNNNNQQLNAEVNKFMNEIINDSKLMKSPSPPPPPPPPVTFWTECIDKNTGHPYYWNTETKEVTWELPQEYDEYLKNTRSTEADRWIMCYTDDDDVNNKQLYYVNEYTRKVSWEKPIGIICELKMNTDIDSMETTTTVTPNTINSKNIAEPETTVIIEKISESTVKPSASVINQLTTAADKKRSKKFSMKKKYPSFMNDDDDDEKIELITSFDCKSNSSSDNENEPLEKAIPNLDINTLTLVASEYNSDDENNNNNNPTENSNGNNKKCVFPISSSPASSALSSIPTTSVITLSTNKIHTSLTTLKDNVNRDEMESTSLSSSSSSSSSSLLNTDDITIQTPIVKIQNTFASIITGGRNPNDSELSLIEHENILQNGIGDDQLKAIPHEENLTESIELDKKLFKRKRRIEFNTTISKHPKCIKISSDPDSDSSSRNIDLANTESSHQIHFDDADNKIINDNSNKNTNTSSSSSSSSLYNNFQPLSHVEFDELNSSVTAKDDGDENVDEKEIMNLKLEINGKLKFLCDIKNVTPAQLLFIQFQTLFEAYERKALQSTYILNWLTNLSNDIRLFEKDAVPNGWKCYWNRNKCQYYYKHLESGKIQCDYPQIADDVKVDNVQEQPQLCGAATTGGVGATTKTIIPKITESEIPTMIPNIEKIITAPAIISTSTVVDEELMDICTTPPPPPIISQCPLSPSNSSLLNDEFVQHQKYTADTPPEAPKWDHAISAKIFDEPLPPGIDISEYERPNPTEKKSKSLTIELASFYSDLAILETVVTAPPALTTNPIEISHEVISSPSAQTSNAIINPIDTTSVITATPNVTSVQLQNNTIDDAQHNTIGQTQESNEMNNNDSNPVAPTTTTGIVISANNISTNTNNVNDSIKKIKKEKLTKGKKVKVRRTCETDLNNWINKWQKAQKELDG